MSTSEWMLKYLMGNLQGEHFHLIKDILKINKVTPVCGKRWC